MVSLLHREQTAFQKRKHFLKSTQEVSLKVKLESGLQILRFGAILLPNPVNPEYEISPLLYCREIHWVRQSFP